MDWDSFTMASLHLTVTEHRYYGDTFIYCCENADTDSMPLIKVAGLLRSANLPEDVTMKILGICIGNKGNTQLGKKQFYAILKLVAAHQAGLEISKDMVTTPLDIVTLPRFTSAAGDEHGRRSSDLNRSGMKSRYLMPDSTTESESEAESPKETGGSTDSPTPTNSVIQDRNNEIGDPPEEVWTISDEQRGYYVAQFAQLQPDPEGLLAGPVARNFFKRSRLPVAELRRIWQLADVTRDGALSLQEFYVAMHLVVLRRNHVPLPHVLPPSLSIPLVMQTITDSPTPTNSVIQDRNNEIGDENILDSVSGGWQGLLLSEEQRQLLGTEEESSEQDSSDEGDGDGDSGFPPEEVWTISDEQRGYYVAQFAQLQPDPEGLLAGPVARKFFKKSRLPVAELRRIWQLADVTRDGALSLQEFYVAMHLVALRRNHVPLPHVLPPSLSIPLVMQTTTDSPTPTNRVIQDRNNEIGDENILDSVSGGWQGLLLSEEQRQLLGTEEESSEQHSSDEGDGDGDSGFPPEEVWTISDEQRGYYVAQFAQLQPDPEGLLGGPVAKKFFKKSRLPVAELRRIWQLADVTRDGALSLQEFYVAMHLVVLRRNHVPLPNVLPPSLSIPLVMQTITAPPAIPPTSTQKSSPPPVTNTSEKTKEWTKFVDSPTGGNSSSLTSPGLQLVNFDFQKSAVERDPKILHPVPLRVTPEAAILASGANGSSSSCTTLGDDDLQYTAASLQRTLMKKPVAAEEALIVTPKKEPPPPPPPRPYKTHARSSSLDLNKLGKNGQSFLGAPPLVPPRISPGITSPRKLVGQRSEGEGQRTVSESQGFVADFSHFSPKSELPENTTLESTLPQSQQFTGVCGAFQIYRKPSPRRDEEGGAIKDEMEESKKLSLQELRERNTELRLVCKELTRELAIALQERTTLCAKLLLLR